jgi:hypothetical protein
MAGIPAAARTFGWPRIGPTCRRCRSTTFARSETSIQPTTSGAVTQLAARRAELEVEIHRLERQVELLQDQLSALRVRTPGSGAVLDWNPEDLLRRHVQPGQELLEVGDARGDWIVDVDFVEKNASAIAEAWTRSAHLPASFILSSAPDRAYEGWLVELGAAVRLQDRENVLRGRVRIPKAPDRPLLRSGLAVRVRVDCGTRSLGYVLGRDVVDFVRGLLFF